MTSRCPACWTSWASPLAAELVTGAAVYRVPIDDTALVFQVGQPAERPADPERAARIGRVQQALRETLGRSEGGRISLEDAGLSAEKYARYQADVAEASRPPVNGPDGLAAAVAAARAAGLLAPVARGDEPGRHFVHRWTARALAALRPGATRHAHQRAAACWRWRVATFPQKPRRRHRAAPGGPLPPSRRRADDQALAAHYAAVNQLRDWGQYGRAAELCRETLTWLTPDSREAAVTAGKPGILAQLRGDYDTAAPLYRRALDTSERIGDQGGTAASYHQLGTLAQDWGDYDTAEPLYRHALDILERISNQAGMATSYAGLGGLSEARGNLDQAVTYP